MGEVLHRRTFSDGLFKFEFTLTKGANSINFNLVSSKMPPIFSNNASVHVAALIDISLWHQRLGHASFPNIERALTHCKVSCTSNNNDCSSICVDCHNSKKHKLSFDVSLYKETKPLELVHSD